MLIGEPAPTQADLHFRLFGIPVRVHPFFWVTALFLGMGGRQADPQQTLVWIAVVFLSVLVHELGHAALQIRYGGHPWITLYGFGGLASCNDCDRSPWRQIVILLAGPFAGFLLALIVVAAIRLSGNAFGIVTLPQQFNIEATGLSRAYLVRLGPLGFYFEPLQSGVLNHVIFDLLQINVMWGVLNLLPVYPLDGGQIAREVFSLRNPRAGVVQSLQLSAGVAVLVAAYALLNERFYMCLMFGYLAYTSFQTLQMYRNHWR
jgi:stage IV sporulation protein FB